MELNGLGGIVLPFNLAVGDKIGDVSFYVPTVLPGAASLAELHPSLEQELQSSRMTTLDVKLAELRAPKIDLIKCDVEGAELSVLKGGRQRIAQDQPILMFELLRKWSRVFGYHPNDAFKLLADMDYRAFAVGRGPPRWIDEVTEETLETNFIFLTPSHQRELEILARFGCLTSST
jgi:FkbM family methyltransferase